MRSFITLAAIATLTACGPAPQAQQAQLAPNTATAAVTYGPDVVHPQGVRDVRFGNTRADLDDRLIKTVAQCNAHVTDLPQGSLVFAPDDRLVLLWFDAPLRTAEGISTASTLDAAREAYPQAKELKAPEGSYRFDGLLIADGDRGFLFLHDGKTVRKAVAGYEQYLDRLFNTGFGAC